MKILQGYDERTFERMFKDNYRLMYRLAFSILEDPDLAKDAVQQVFARVWQNKPDLSLENIKGYLLAATKNRCVNMRRDKARRKNHDKHISESLYDNLDKSHKDELMVELYKAISSELTEQDQRVIFLHYDMDLTYKETANALGISPSAVNKHITNSLEKLRKTLKDKE
ncbi:MAG: sigma-70 family RNA polymerase sigma factor, partial [Bacteroidales bacterium]|nr:sigma-70 family RNA polymerase sigma factor [Bacteroidales bacterium]